MPNTRIVRTSLAAMAVAAGLVATATPAQAGWGVRVGLPLPLVVPPLVVSVGSVPPVAPYYRPYAAGCGLNGTYAPAYAPYVAPYYATRAVVAPYAVLAPRAAFARVWVPGSRPHWEVRRAARYGYRRW